MRSLAQRASDSAKEIKRLISQSTDQVEAGSALVHDTGAALTKMIDRIRSVTTLIADIAGSAREQSLGLSEINTGVKQLDEVTQRNAAVVIQSSSSSDSLHSDAVRLSETMNRFRVADAPLSAQRPALVASAQTAVFTPVPAMDFTPVPAPVAGLSPAIVASSPLPLCRQAGLLLRARPEPTAPAMATGRTSDPEGSLRGHRKGPGPNGRGAFPARTWGRTGFRPILKAAGPCGEPGCPSREGAGFHPANAPQAMP